jgi:Icc-related predicted phosphoesterase
MMRLVSLLIFAVYFIGCGRSAEPDYGKKENQKFLRCAEPYSDGKKESVSLSPLTVDRDGIDVRVHGIKRGLIVLGLLAGITEPVAANFANLDYFLAQFKEAGAQAILVAGDVGSMETEMSKILSHLAKAPIPILVTPGAQENFDLFRKVMAAVRKKHPQLIDMTLARRAKIGHLNIVSLPGYHKPFYLKARERGCAYGAADLEATGALFKDKGVNVIFSPSPPRGEGRAAVDRAQGDVNIGDPNLTEMLKAQKVKFGLFGHVYESGGHATLADGRSNVQAGIWQESLFVQAGSAEAIPLSLVGEGRSTGMAQIVSFSAARARIQTVPAPTTP